MLSPDVDFTLWFLYIWGSWANSQEMMLHVPRMVERRARFVGTQVWREEERLYRKSFAGSQCAGKDGATMCSGDR
jgi:hypothetical protein